MFDASGIIDTVRAVRDITFRDLFTHTSGLTYGSMNATPVDALYRDTGVGVFADHPDADLMETTEKLAGLPLLAHPGTEWNYSVASDVLAALVQAISGRRFGAFLQERILGRLRMEDTSFRVPAEKMDRLAAIYTRDPKGGVTPGDDMGEYRVPGERRMQSGGGGLVSAAGTSDVLPHVVEQGGARRRTTPWPQDGGMMTTNHLPRRHGRHGSTTFQ